MKKILAFLGSLGLMCLSSPISALAAEEEGAAAAKIEQYEQNLRSAGYGDVLDRTVKKRAKRNRTSEEKGAEDL